MRDVVICEPVRTPIGAYGGSLKPLLAAELAAQAIRGLLDRSAVEPNSIGDVILGHCNSSSEAPAIGRVAALDAGLPVTVGGMHVDRRCGSGLQAVLQAVMQVGSGANDVIVAGGVESMSNASFYTLDARWGAARTGMRMHDSLGRARVTAGGKHHPIAGGMIETAENLRREYAIGREEQDRLALASHQRAVAAQQSGVFAEEIIPVKVRGRKGEEIVEIDEHPRADVSLERLAALKPLLGDEDPQATVTAGNASGQNDAAALCVVASREEAERQGLTPLVRLTSWCLAGVQPEVMGIGPVPATARALELAGLTLADIDVIELNEAFAVQALAVMREWKFADSDLERTNVHGSGISLGHPVGLRERGCSARWLGSFTDAMAVSVL